MNEARFKADLEFITEAGRINAEGREAASEAMRRELTRQRPSGVSPTVWAASIESAIEQMNAEMLERSAEAIASVIRADWHGAS